MQSPQNDSNDKNDENKAEKQTITTNVGSQSTSNRTHDVADLDSVKNIVVVDNKEYRILHKFEFNDIKERGNNAWQWLKQENENVCDKLMLQKMKQPSQNLWYLLPILFEHMKSSESIESDANIDQIFQSLKTDSSLQMETVDNMIKIYRDNDPTIDDQLIQTFRSKLIKNNQENVKQHKKHLSKKTINSALMTHVSSDESSNKITMFQPEYYVNMEKTSKSAKQSEIVSLVNDVM